jgi:hypothetical protein
MEICHLLEFGDSDPKGLYVNLSSASTGCATLVGNVCNPLAVWGESGITLRRMRI